MRGGFGLLRKPPFIGSSSDSGIPTASRISSSFAFSTSSSDGGSGRGRGRGVINPSHFAFVANQPDLRDADSEDPDSRSAAPSGAGHGRCKPPVTTPSSPFRPSMAQHPQPTATQGRGRAIHPPTELGQQPQEQQKSTKPFFFVKEDDSGHGAIPVINPIVPRLTKPIGEANLPPSLMSVLGGTGRGKPGQSLGPATPVDAKQVNRHLRRRQVGAPSAEAPAGGDSGRPKLSREEAKKKAMGILTKDGVGREEAVGGRGRGRGRGGRGRGRGARDRRWEHGEYGQEPDDDGDEEDDDLHMGDDADGEKLAHKLGPEMMEKLTEAFENVSNDVVPCVLWDEHVEAYNTNLQFEFEPEYAMGDFETNPDIDENDPMPLREALEKMKPFLMVYEGIQNEAEWQEAVEDTMKRAPLLEKIVEHYSGPERVTANQQQEELERVAKTLPASAPDPLKRFTNRAVLSLQSNPGWGFHRKCQFMDKLVWEASQSYK